MIAPSFVYLITQSSGDAARAAQNQLQEATVLGLMRATLLWPAYNRVAKGAVTRKLNDAEHSARLVISPAWQNVEARANRDKAAWWYATVVPRLLGLGLGSMFTVVNVEWKRIGQVSGDLVLFLAADLF